MNQPAVHVVFSGGGTGGHLFPGIAVARELEQLRSEIRITFVGRGSAFERSQVTRAGYEFRGIAATPFPRKPWQAVGFLANHLACMREATQFLRDNPASIVVGLGGYASVPVARAATARKVPLVLLEQNVVPGRANRWLASAAELICSATDCDPAWKTSCPIQVVGNPVRGEFARPRAVNSDHRSHRRLVVLGGSQGAQSLNEQVPRALYKLGPAVREWQIVHQSGERDLAATRELYRKLGLQAHVGAFVHNLAEILVETDLAISRAGGTTLAELSASGVPALLIPYPHASRNHQRRNAEVYVAAGAARMVDIREIEGRLDNQVAAALRELIGSETLRSDMAASMTRLARPRAAHDVATLIHNLIGAPTLQRAG